MLADPERTDLTIESMAALYIREMRATYSSGPYLIGAPSLGGFILYEMVKQLHLQGTTPALAAMIDVWIPGTGSYHGFATKFARLLANLRAGGWRYLLKKIGEKSRYVRDKFVKGDRESAGVKLYRRSLAMPAAQVLLHSQAHLRVVAKVQVRALPGKFVLARARYEGTEVLGHWDSLRGLGCWRGRSQVLDLPTGHSVRRS